MTLLTGRDGFEFKRNDCRNDSIRKRKKRQRSEQDRKTKRKKCLQTGCPKTGHRGWAKGFCFAHAHLQNLKSVKKAKKRKRLKVKDVMKDVKKPINAKKQKKLTTNEKELTKEKVEAKNLEIRLLKPVAGFAQEASMDSDSESEFFHFPACDIRKLAPR